jgi:hypothetical protein
MDCQWVNGGAVCTVTDPDPGGVGWGGCGEGIGFGGGCGGGPSQDQTGTFRWCEHQEKLDGEKNWQKILQACGGLPGTPAKPQKQQTSGSACTPSVFNPSCKPPTKPSCPAVFAGSFFSYNPNGASQAPTGLGPEDAAKATAGAFAMRHIIQRGLVVPLRSSIVRNFLLVGEVASDLLSYGPLIYSEVNALIDEGAAWKSGACTTIWSSN